MELEIINTYHIRQEELTLRIAWENFIKMGEEDALVIKSKKGETVVNRNDLSKVLMDTWLPEKYELCKQLKANVYNHSRKMQEPVEDALSEIKEFKQKYLIIEGNKT